MVTQQQQQASVNNNDCYFNVLFPQRANSKNDEKIRHLVTLNGKRDFFTFDSKQVKHRRHTEREQISSDALVYEIVHAELIK